MNIKTCKIYAITSHQSDDYPNGWFMRSSEEVGNADVDVTDNSAILETLATYIADTELDIQDTGVSLMLTKKANGMPVLEAVYGEEFEIFDQHGMTTGSHICIDRCNHASILREMHRLAWIDAEECSVLDTGTSLIIVNKSTRKTKFSIQY